MGSRGCSERSVRNYHSKPHNISQESRSQYKILKPILFKFQFITILMYAPNFPKFLRTKINSLSIMPKYLPHKENTEINPLNAELNPICHLLALLGVHSFLHVSRIRVKSLNFRLLMSYIWSTYS